MKDILDQLVTEGQQRYCADPACRHRALRHYSATMRDIHGEAHTWPGVGKCAIQGCPCRAFAP